MAHFVDKYREQIAQLAGMKELRRARKEAFDAFRSATKRCCEANGIASSTIVEPETAHGLLQAVHCEIVKELEALTEGYSSLRWLFMLRRLPRAVFEGELSTTNAYDAALTEVLSARSRRVEHISGQDSSCFFHIDRNCVKRLLRFSEGGRTLSQVHVLVRWCGKGAGLGIAKDWLPIAEHSEDVRAAALLYDKRCEKERNSWSAAGTVFRENDATTTDCVLVAHPIIPHRLQLPDLNTIDAIVSPCVIPLSDISQLTQNAIRAARTPWPVESALALWIARAAWFYMVRRHRAMPLLRQILNTGYLLVSEETAEEWISEVAGSCNEFVNNTVGHTTAVNSLTDLLTVAGKDRGDVWPLWPRDLVRTVPGLICVDLSATSYAIQDSLEYTAETGPIANVRSHHFESAVQRIIDETQWRPDGELRNLIGLTLRKGRSAITDIDAVGISGNTLLFVSCKSRLKSRQYDIGKYSVVRNAATAIAAAKTEWEAVLDNIRNTPSELNWDFRCYTKVIAVVCTSSVFFAPLGVMSTNPDGVTVIAVNELREWLNSPR